MDRYQRGYDEGYGRYFDRGGRYGGRRGMGYDTGLQHGRSGYDPDFRRSRSGYDRDFTSRRRFPFRGYDRDFWGGGPFAYGTRYDYGYGSERPRKSRSQTDYGDPFGDRQRNTPMRVVRGEPAWRHREPAPRRYGRDYHAWGFPQHYEPYSPEAGFHID